MNRRRFLKWMVVGAVFSLASLYILKSRYRRITQIFKDYLSPRLNTDSPRGRLKEDDVKNIIALAEVLILKDETLDADEIWVRNFVNNKTENEPGYLFEYQNGVRLLDRITRNLKGEHMKFHELPMDIRNILLHQNFGMDGSLDKIFFRLQFFTHLGKLKIYFWYFVIKELLYDFYSSPYGWAVVGYTSYPGVPGNPREYTEALKPF